MESDFVHWRKGVWVGAGAGVVWSWVVLCITLLAKVSPFEQSLLYNLIIYMTGGALFGILLGVLLFFFYNKLPFQGTMPKAILLSTSFWFFLRLGGFLLSLRDPYRYHQDTLQNLQGCFLAVFLGLLIGSLWNIPWKEFR